MSESRESRIKVVTAEEAVPEETAEFICDVWSETGYEAENSGETERREKEVKRQLEESLVAKAEALDGQVLVLLPQDTIQLGVNRGWVSQKGKVYRLKIPVERGVER